MWKKERRGGKGIGSERILLFLIVITMRYIYTDMEIRLIVKRRDFKKHDRSTCVIISLTEGIVRNLIFYVHICQIVICM